MGKNLRIIAVVLGVGVGSLGALIFLENRMGGGKHIPSPMDKNKWKVIEFDEESINDPERVEMAFINILAYNDIPMG